MMKKLLTILLAVFLLIISTPVIALSSKDSINLRIDSLSNRLKNTENQFIQQNRDVDLLKNSLDKLEGQMNNQDSRVDTAFDGVSTQISTSSFLVAIFAIVIAVVGVGIGIYFNRIEKNVHNLRNDNEFLLQKNLAIKADLEKLSYTITHDKHGLFTIIRNEESDHLVNRLLSVPEDIINIFPLLVSRELEASHFLIIKEALLCAGLESQYCHQYSILLFQQFAGITFLDTALRENFMKTLNNSIEASFKNDIIKSTNDFFVSLTNDGLSKYIAEINAYINELINSEFSEIKELYLSIFNSIPKRDDKFYLYSIIEKNDTTLLFRKEYGQYLIDFKQDNPSDLENYIISEVEQINSRL